MPNEDNKWLKFNHLGHQLRVPFVIYADFECYTEPIDACQPTEAATQDYQHHTPSGFCYCIVSDHPEYTINPAVHHGPDVIDTFLSELQKEEKHINDILSHPAPIMMMPADTLDFDAATRCHICSNDLGADKVRDHCHLTGAYRGAAHSECNLQYRFTRGMKFTTFRRFSFPSCFTTCGDMILISSFQHSDDIAVTFVASQTTWINTCHSLWVN